LSSTVRADTRVLRGVSAGAGAADVSISRIAQRVLGFAYGLIALQALVAVPVLAIELTTGQYSPTSIAVGFAVAVLGAAFGIRSWSRLRGLRTRLVDGLGAVPRGRFLVGLLMTATVLRVAWIAAFPAPTRSDGAVYVALATALAAGQPYATDLGRAYWPPGYPLFLTPIFWLFGASSMAIVASNLALCAASVLAVLALGRAVADEPTARLAAVLVALWPNHVTVSGLAVKEVLLVALLPAALLCHLPAVHEPHSSRGTLLAAGAGLAAGAAALTQPSLLALPLVLSAHALVLTEAPRRRALARAVVIVATSAAVIAPWTARNYLVLGSFVPVATNGGHNFYRANNPLATGRYVEPDAGELVATDEIVRDATGYRRGWEWIRSAPLAFLGLAWKKQLLFLGDDAYGFYETLKRGLGRSDASYALLKAASNGVWWLAWLVVLIALWSDPDRLTRPGFGCLILISLLLYSIHSVFESGGKYHLPLLGPWAILTAVCVAEREKSRSPCGGPHGGVRLERSLIAAVPVRRTASRAVVGE